jgi:hypothetical protein
MQTIETLLNTHASHLESVRPGLPTCIPLSAMPGDAPVAQGDLYLRVVAIVPRGYEAVTNPTDKHRQLVPESGAGSHHRLDSLDGVTIYYPPGFDLSRDTDSLLGPVLMLTARRVIRHEPGHDHPHGNVVIECDGPPRFIECGYQREWSKEEARERRAKD